MIKIKNIDDLIVIDKSRFHDAVKAYWFWKELNSISRNSHNRGINLPETVSEPILCYALSFSLNRGSGGDAIDVKNDDIIEIKATSNFDSDLSSFSPKTNFDKLYFFRLNQREDIAFIYDLNIGSEALEDISVNKNETFKNHQDQKRRPRFSIIKHIIEKNDLQPIVSIDLRTKKIKKFE